MASISERELREHFGRRSFFTVAANVARADAAVRAGRRASALEATAAALELDNLTITPDALKGHFVARAHITDLQPSQMTAAIARVEEEIRKTYPWAHRTGWSGACDGLTLYFAAYEAA